MGLKTKGRKEIEDRRIAEGFCYWVAGSFMLMKAEDFSAIKGFDPNTFLYCEEKILSERLAAIKKQVYYLSSPLIISIGGMTTSKYLSNRKKDMILYDSELYFYKEYMRINEFTFLVMKIARYIYFKIYY
jgi:GT2 family glycosyltransferase